MWVFRSYRTFILCCHSTRFLNELLRYFHIYFKFYKLIPTHFDRNLITAVEITGQKNCVPFELRRYKTMKICVTSTLNLGAERRLSCRILPAAAVKLSPIKSRYCYLVIMLLFTTVIRRLSNLTCVKFIIFFLVVTVFSRLIIIYLWCVFFFNMDRFHGCRRWFRKNCPTQSDVTIIHYTHNHTRSYHNHTQKMCCHQAPYYNHSVGLKIAYPLNYRCVYQVLQRLF